MACAVGDDECTAGRLRRGMCERHYRRWLKSGETSSPQIDILSHYEVTDTECWRWLGALWSNGYGKTSRRIHDSRLAHRVFYVEHRGAIPEGLDLDHLCRNRWCVNPEHLQPVSRAVNLRRGLDARQFCGNGHDLRAPGAFKPGTRECIQCWRVSYRAAGARYRARKRAQSA